MSELKKQVCFALYSASNAVMRAYRPLLDKLDLTYTQYLVMLSLWARDEVSLKEIGQETGLDAGTLTPIVKRLESKGWLTRTVSSEDERQKCIRLTEAGRELRFRAYVSTFDGAYSLVKAGLGQTILPMEAVSRYARLFDLRVIPLLDPWALGEFVICVRDVESLSLSARRLLNHLLARAPVV